jgi:hypothetical protein
MGKGFGKRGLFGGFLVLGLVACGDETSSELKRLPQMPDIQETVIPGQIFTRGPGGEVVSQATYATQEDVHLMGTGLPDGRYYFQITTPGCMLLLAGPDANDPNVPDTSGRIIDVEEGVFGPVALAPFNTTSDENGFYEVSITPVNELGEADAGCFGFSDLESVSTKFVVEEEVAPAPETDGTLP